MLFALSLKTIIVMVIGTFTVSTGVGNKWQIQSDAQSLLMTCSYKCTSFSAPVTDANFATAVADLAAAFNGKLSILYTDSDNGINQVIIPSTSFADIVEGIAGQKGRIEIVTGGSATTAIAHIRIPLSEDGTIRVSGNASITVEFEGFTNAVLGGGNYDGSISLETFVTPNYTKKMQVVEVNGINTGQTATVDLTLKKYLIFSKNLSKMNIFSLAGSMHELPSTNLRTFATQSTRAHWKFMGVPYAYANWIVLPVHAHKNALVALSSGNVVYTVHDVVLP